MFVFVITNKGAEKELLDRSYKGYKLGDYSSWLQKKDQQCQHMKEDINCMHVGNLAPILSPSFSTIPLISSTLRIINDNYNNLMIYNSPLWFSRKAPRRVVPSMVVNRSVISVVGLLVAQEHVQKGSKFILLVEEKEQHEKCSYISCSAKCK
ncbi:hypothetical protein VNO77_19667 [Canavalia gladiata]|uniref:Uncharacterized protein n=1 Tax=Canavalia gladiata TaxID=3824 RepID=A0AAN9LN15_CANGL